MMKKILLLSSLIVIGLASCKEDEPKITPGYVTDGLPLPEEKNVLVLMGSSIQNPGTGVFEAIRLGTQDEYAGRMHTVNMLSSNATKYYDPYADTIMMNFQSPTAPFYVVDGIEVLPPELPNAVKRAQRGNPVLAVAHKVTQNDTAWVVNHKVEFFRDSVYDEFYIDTYMLARLKAKEYSPGEPEAVNLRIPNVTDLITNPAMPMQSQWATDVPNLDSSRTVAQKGSVFYHDYLFVDKYDSTSTWGPKLGSYWRFNGEFYAGDKLGTESFPIVQYFLKKRVLPEVLEAYDIQFMSVVWVLNPSTGSMEYVNSYLSDSKFTVPQSF